VLSCTGNAESIPVQSILTQSISRLRHRAWTESFNCGWAAIACLGPSLSAAGLPNNNTTFGGPEAICLRLAKWAAGVTGRVWMDWRLLETPFPPSPSLLSRLCLSNPIQPTPSFWPADRASIGIDTSKKRRKSKSNWTASGGRNVRCGNK
jgi:hypothetical protein